MAKKFLFVSLSRLIGDIAGGSSKRGKGFVAIRPSSEAQNIKRHLKLRSGEWLNQGATEFVIETLRCGQ